MRKKPWFYVLVLGLSVLMAVFTRLTMAPRIEEFYLFPDAPFWIFLQALLSIYVLDTLNGRWLAQGQEASGAGYYFRLMLVGAVWSLLLMQGLGLLLGLLPGSKHAGWEWYPVVRSFFSDLILYLIISSVYLPFLYQQHAATAQTALEGLQKEAAHARLIALQQHVDPHFLFNNLNILSALIEPDNTAARDYVGHLANLYRYLVRTRQQEVVPMAEELAFAQDYQYLLSKRFGVAYQFEQNLRVTPQELQSLLLPPRVLQELLTNAVKHNLASRAQPLHVRLIISAEALTVQNSRQPRPRPTEGEKSGLAGLRARFALLTDRPVVIADTPEAFSVTLPLLPALALPNYATPDYRG